MADLNAASLLFPNDVPTERRTPDWYRAQQAAAEARLMGSGRQAADASAALVFPNEARREQPAASAERDPAKVLFGSEGGTDYDGLVSGELDGRLGDALKDGDTARADALRHATSSLATDFKAAGTPAEDIREAFEIVRHSAGLTPPTPAQMEASYAAGMAAVQAEGISDADLGAARALIRDLNILSPGVLASIEAHGAGNDIRIIRAAVRESKRRGYA